jgi:diadenosine tetraphosphate (Ap4A) HIT family hydrolase
MSAVRLGSLALSGSASSYKYVVAVSLEPTLRGQLIYALPSVRKLSSLTANDFVLVWSSIKDFVKRLNHASNVVVRYGAATDGTGMIHLFPLNSSEAEWQPVIHSEETFNEHYPGYLTTKNGPEATTVALDSMQARITRVSGWSVPSFDFPGGVTDTNLFARLVRGEILQWRIWEDSEHVAFLTPFANTPAFTVIVPRRHLPSDILSLDNDTAFVPLMEAAHKVSTILMEALGVDQVGMFLEGFEIDYAHVKLVPIPAQVDERVSADDIGVYHDAYPGFLTTQAGTERTAAEVHILDSFEELCKQSLQGGHLKEQLTRVTVSTVVVKLPQT